MSNNNPFSADYDIPKAGGNYLKIKPNTSVKLRMLDNPITGWEWWKEADKENKPFRVKNRDDAPPGSSPKHFWAVPVWNYDEQKLQIWTVKQRGIMEKILVLSKNKSWGSPVGDKGYDLNIERLGDGLLTKYSVTPEPKSPVPVEAVKAFAEAALVMEVLYSNGDPFNPEGKEEDKDLDIFGGR